MAVAYMMMKCASSSSLVVANRLCSTSYNSSCGQICT